jgi:thioredoxin-related protein
MVPKRLLRMMAICSALLLVTDLLAQVRAEPPAGTLPQADKSQSNETKSKRPAIYNPEADGKELIAEALKRAKPEHKHVLVEWGGNWCGWCHKLHDVFIDDELARPIVAEEYELVLVDSDTNRELMQHYGGKDRQYAFPHLTVLDAEGKILTNQETSSLEDGPKHDPQAVATFLKKWQPERLNAEELLAAALQRATDEEKRILLHVGTPYCGWCKTLTKFLDEHSTALSRDFVDLPLDTVRMTAGKEVAARFHPAGSVGVPWMVILDSSGKVLSTCVGPKGNCGYPVEPAEIDHFRSMLASTKQRLTESELEQIRADLDAYRVERERQQATARQE